MIQIISVIISGIFSILVIILTHEISLINKNRDNRITESLLLFKLVSSTMNLTKGIATALKRGYCNGDVDLAIKEVEESKKEYEEFLHKIAISEIEKKWGIYEIY